MFLNDDRSLGELIGRFTAEELRGWRIVHRGFTFLSVSATLALILSCVTLPLLWFMDRSDRTLPLNDRARTSCTTKGVRK